MSKTKPGESNSILESVKQLDEQLEEAAQNFDATIDQLRNPDAAATAESLAGLETGQDTPEQQPQERQQEQHESIIEKAFEEYRDNVDEDKPEESPYVIRKATSKRDEQAAQPTQKTPQQVRVEEILADGLAEVFHSMSPEDQAKFKAKGEEVAEEIVTLMDQLKLTAKRALKLLTSWLRTIPGVDRYFLEQEAKIKTEEVMRYAREHSQIKR